MLSDEPSSIYRWQNRRLATDNHHETCGYDRDEGRTCFRPLWSIQELPYIIKWHEKSQGLGLRPIYEIAEEMTFGRRVYMYESILT